VRALLWSTDMPLEVPITRLSYFCLEAGVHFCCENVVLSFAAMSQDLPDAMLVH
jgi:hypothetical protein